MGKAVQWGVGKLKNLTSKALPKLKTAVKEGAEKLVSRINKGFASSGSGHMNRNRGFAVNPFYKGGRTTEIPLLETSKHISGEVNDHHIFPKFRGKSKPYADFIADRGIDVDQYTVTISAGKGGAHMNNIHGKGGWNQKWMNLLIEIQMQQQKIYINLLEE